MGITMLIQEVDSFGGKEHTPHLNPHSPFISCLLCFSIFRIHISFFSRSFDNEIFLATVLKI